MELRRFLLLLTVALLILLLITAWFYPLSGDFRTENTFWNGTSNILTGYQAQPLASLEDLPTPSQGVTLILLPCFECSPAELEQLEIFVTQGGRLILADDYGYGNRILRYLGLRTRFTGWPLLDPLLNYKNEQFPVINHLEDTPLMAGAGNLVFNRATSLADESEDNTIAWSSSFSFLDFNGNGTWEYGEPIGSMPVISRHELGGGQIIIISDTSLFINSMESMGGNDIFIENIAATTTSLFIDQSHLPTSELHRTKSFLARTRDFITMPLVTVVLVILALGVALRPLWHKRGERN